ncbi:hypothetical protein JHD46_04245 [Sulfurimonas sp. SAG-AH-194-C20]|nr:hypothetical protein [Sulfurimonas sp. SAG-AH-194-C20]MDF1878848.1 hypothetical protein [Sulfurimonas sp. SAG-AH-194-C20]
MQYDKEDLIQFEQQKQVLLDMNDSIDEEIFNIIPDKVKVDISHLIDTENCIDINVYRFISYALVGLDRLNKAEMYSKDFSRDLKSLKKKVDFLSRLSPDPIIIELPEPLSVIKAKFYRACKVIKTPDKLIGEIFDITLNCKTYKGKFSENDINFPSSAKEKEELNMIKYLNSIRKDVEEKDGSINETKLLKYKENFMDIINASYIEDKYYIGKPDSI